MGFRAYGLMLAVSLASSPGVPALAAPFQSTADRQLELFFEKKTETVSPALRKEIEQAVRELGNQEPHQRRESRDKLLAYGKLATPFLVRELQGGNQLRIDSALLALGSLRDEEALPFIRNELDRNRGMSGTFSALALGKCGDRLAIAALSDVGASRGATAFTRAAAALALGRLGTPDATDALLKALKRETDAKALGAILLALGRSTPRAGVHEELVKALKGTNDFLRRIAVLAMGDLGDERSVGILIDRLLWDGDPEVRHCSAVALSRYTTAEATAALLQALRKEGSPDRQAVIVLSLANHPQQKVAETLVRIAWPPTPRFEVRRAAVIALSRFPGEVVQHTLTQSLRDDSALVRSVAVLALAMRESSDSIPYIEKLIADTDPTVRRAVAIALGALGGSSAVPSLQRLEKSPEKTVSGKASEVRVRIEKGRDPKDLLRFEFSTLCSRSEELRRAYANHRLWDLFELGRRLEKPLPSGPQSRALSAPLQDLRLWLETDPFF